MDKKISIVEIIIMTIIVGGAELFDIFTAIIFPIPIIGQIVYVINLIVDIIVVLITQLWFIIRGGIGFRNQVRIIIGYLVDIVPFLEMIPIRLLSLFIAIYLINNPKVMKIAKKATGKINVPIKK